MPKSRGGILLIAFFILLLALVVWLLGRDNGLNLFRAQPGQIPIELEAIVPEGWNLLAQQSEPCNFDDDPDNEWLLLYRYDQTSVNNVYAGDKQANYSIIGGVIYDAQVNRAPQELGNTSPYRPALLVPYKLLPDYYTGKGQGYLGESDAKFYKYTPAQEDAAPCKAEELYFLGYSYGPLPTRLSVFRWAGRAVGYRGVHFIGNAHVEAKGVIEPTARVESVTTYNRLANHRSVLCEVRSFTQQGDRKELAFPEDPNRFTIDFCYGTPLDPAYPEAALIALLRGGNPPDTGGPTGPSFLTKNAELDPRLSFLRTAGRTETVRILSVSNQGTVAPSPQDSQECSPAAIVLPDPPPTDERAKHWWCAAEEAYVEAEIVRGSQIYRAVARLISIANEQVTTDVHWRVASLTLQ